MTEAISELKALAKQFNVTHLAFKLLDDSKFQTCSGSGKAGKHHFGRNLLPVHILEVCQVALTCNKLLNCGVDERLLYLSCIYHDAAKTKDYKEDENGEIKYQPHKFLIHHVSGSTLMFNEYAKDLLSQEEIDQVIHCILSHHGSRSAGSPVEPLTKMSWLLHHADSMSARVYECEY